MNSNCQLLLVSRQIRAARGLLHWSARVLAERAGVGISTVQRMERAGGPVTGNIESVRRVQDVLKRAGVEFLADDDGLAVRLKAPLRRSDTGPCRIGAAQTLGQDQEITSRPRLPTLTTANQRDF